MRFVVDTNQAAAFVNTAPLNQESRPRVVIPPLVWAEILLAPEQYHQDRLRAIARCDVLFGIDVPTIFDRISRLTEEDVRVFDPVFAPDSCEHEISYLSFMSPHAGMLQRARELKDTASRDARDLGLQLHQYRKQNRDRRSRGEALETEKVYHTIEEADLRFISASNSPIRKCVLDAVTCSGTRPLQAFSEDSFYTAILENSALRRFLRVVLTLELAYTNHWADQNLNNIDLSPNRNDFTDATLAMYARDGDAILTNDSYFKRVFRHIDREAKVRLTAWDEASQECLPE